MTERDSGAPGVLEKALSRVLSTPSLPLLWGQGRKGETKLNHQNRGSPISFRAGWQFSTWIMVLWIWRASVLSGCNFSWFTPIPSPTASTQCSRISIPTHPPRPFPPWSNTPLHPGLAASWAIIICSILLKWEVWDFSDYPIQLESREGFFKKAWTTQPAKNPPPEMNYSPSLFSQPVLPQCRSKKLALPPRSSGCTSFLPSFCHHNNPVSLVRLRGCDLPKVIQEASWTSGDLNLNLPDQSSIPESVHHHGSHTLTIMKKRILWHMYYMWVEQSCEKWTSCAWFGPWCVVRVKKDVTNGRNAHFGGFGQVTKPSYGISCCGCISCLGEAGTAGINLKHGNCVAYWSSRRHTCLILQDPVVIFCQQAEPFGLENLLFVISVHFPELFSDAHVEMSTNGAWRRCNDWSKKILIVPNHVLEGFSSVKYHPW